MGGNIVGYCGVMNHSKKRQQLEKTAQEKRFSIQEVKGYFVKSSTPCRFEEGVFCKTLDDVDLYLRAGGK